MVPESLKINIAFFHRLPNLHINWHVIMENAFFNFLMAFKVLDFVLKLIQVLEKNTNFVLLPTHKIYLIFIIQCSR